MYKEQRKGRRQGKGKNGVLELQVKGNNVTLWQNCKGIGRQVQRQGHKGQGNRVVRQELETKVRYNKGQSTNKRNKSTNHKGQVKGAQNQRR